MLSQTLKTKQKQKLISLAKTSIDFESKDGKQPTKKIEGKAKQ